MERSHEFMSQELISCFYVCLNPFLFGLIR
nr:MAG TPA: membrane protein [Bacteriophage sp.]